MPLDVVIVGGGIGGAVLANLLGSAGWHCLVLEKDEAPPTVVRPEVLWPATVATLSSILPPGARSGDAFLPIHGITLQLGADQALRVTDADLAAAGVQPCSTDPNRTREMLLQTGRFELRRGVEVTEVLRESGRVVGVGTHDLKNDTYGEVRADWTVGDDGAHSLVRLACEIPLRTRLFPVDFLCFAFDWPEYLPYGSARAWLPSGPRDRRPPIAAFPLPRLRGVGLVPVRPARLANAEQLQADWQALLDSEPVVAEIAAGRNIPDDFVHVRRPWGHARRYGYPGAVILGDAAHPVSPAGGQGANMSVADAAALAEAFVHEPTDPLPEYERRRRPANHRSMKFTRLAALGLSLPSFVSGLAFPRVLRWLGRRPHRFARILRNTSTAFLDRPGVTPVAVPE